MKEFVGRNWFLLLLAVVLGAGFAGAGILDGFIELLPRGGIVFAIMFVMAFPLDAQSMWRTLRRPGPALLAAAINIGLLPLVGWGISTGLRGDLAVGLLIVSSVPSTLASAAVWTRRAGGNDAVAMLVTMITSLTCFLVTPLWLYVMTRTDVGTLPLGGMVLNLSLVLVAPILLAQVLRLVGAGSAGRWASQRKIPFGVVAQCGVLTMVLIGAVKSGVELDRHAADQQIAPLDWVVMLAAVVGLHLSMLGVGHFLSRLAGFERADRIAVGFAGSQKTLMAGLHIAIHYYGGLAILPMVAYHVCQLLVDALIAERLRQGLVPLRKE